MKDNLIDTVESISIRFITEVLGMNNPQQVLKLSFVPVKDKTKCSKMLAKFKAFAKSIATREGLKFEMHEFLGYCDYVHSLFSPEKFMADQLQHHLRMIKYSNFSNISDKVTVQELFKLVFNEILIEILSRKDKQQLVVDSVFTDVVESLLSNGNYLNEANIFLREYRMLQRRNERDLNNPEIWKTNLDVVVTKVFKVFEYLMIILTELSVSSRLINIAGERFCDYLMDEII